MCNLSYFLEHFSFVIYYFVYSPSPVTVVLGQDNTKTMMNGDQLLSKEGECVSVLNESVVATSENMNNAAVP